MDEEEELTGPVSCSRKVVFVDTDPLGAAAKERKSGPLIENEMEARLVQQVRQLDPSPSLTPLTDLPAFSQTTEALLLAGVPQDHLGVIALYRQQIKLISRKLELYPDVEVLTADRSQGRDKECILMSLTRSNEEGQVSRRVVGSLSRRGC